MWLLYLNKDDVALWLLVLVWLDESVGVGANWPSRAVVAELGDSMVNVFSRGRVAPRVVDCWSFIGVTSGAVFGSAASSTLSAAPSALPKLLINTPAAFSTRFIWIRPKIGLIHVLTDANQTFDATTGSWSWEAVSKYFYIFGGIFCLFLLFFFLKRGRASLWDCSENLWVFRI